MTYHKNYYEEHKEQYAENSKQWREAHPEQVREGQRRWKARNEGHTYTDQSGYVKYVGYEHPASTPSGLGMYHRVVLWDKLNGQDAPCHWCGTELSWSITHPNQGALCVDHVNTIKDDNSPENLVPTCHRCNATRPGGKARWPGIDYGMATQHGECTFDGCTRAQRSRHLCSRHAGQLHANGELKEIRPYKFSVYVTDNHKTCTGCEQVKSVDDFYQRDGKLLSKCKACCIKRTQAAKLRAA